MINMVSTSLTTELQSHTDIGTLSEYIICWQLVRNGGLKRKMFGVLGGEDMGQLVGCCFIVGAFDWGSVNGA